MMCGNMVDRMGSMIALDDNVDGSFVVGVCIYEVNQLDVYGGDFGRNIFFHEG
jgi:hypothetical protein